MAREIKYTDKSKGQPDLLVLFEQVKRIMKPFAKGNYVIKSDNPGHYDIYYCKEVEMLGRRYPELMLASLLIQKGYVGFYFFPIYLDETLKKKLAPELLRTLKGKTCFHLKKSDPQLLLQIDQTLQLGIDYNRTRGWS